MAARFHRDVNSAAHLFYKRWAQRASVSIRLGDVSVARTPTACSMRCNAPENEVTFL